MSAISNGLKTFCLSLEGLFCLCLFLKICPQKKNCANLLGRSTGGHFRDSKINKTMAFIQLIKTPSRDDMVIQDKWYLPIELLWVGTHVQQRGHNVEILDGQLLSIDEITRRICAPIVGVSFQIYSACHLDAIVAAAKKAGSLVVVDRKSTRLNSS